MNEVPEYLRLNLRRNAFEEIKNVSDVSEDGDFKQLRKMREERKLFGEIPEDKEQEHTEEDVGGGKGPSNNSERGNNLEGLRLEFFSAVVNGRKDTVFNMVDKVRKIAPLSDPALLDPLSGYSVLNVALENKRMDTAELLIEEGDDSLVQNEFITGASKKTALHQITEMNAVEIAKQILTKTDDIHKILTAMTSIDIQGQRPRQLNCVHLAAFYGFTDLVKLYLSYGSSHGIHVDTKNQKGDTPLLWASRWGHVETVKFLLDENANPNEANDKGSTAFYWAIRYEHVTIVKILLENKRQQVDVHKERKLGLVAPIVLAAALGNNEIVKLLLDHGANKNHRIPGGAVPLHYAAKEGHLEVVDTLLNSGADINIQDEKRDNALLNAAKNGHVDIVRILLLNGDNPNHQNQVGHDAWFFAMSQEDNTLLDCLLKNIQRRTGNTPPLLVAARLGNCAKVKHLLDAGVDPLTTDNEGNTFLHIAVLSDQRAVVEKFHTVIAIDVGNNAGNTCLHIAFTSGYLGMVHILLSAKAKTNIKNNKDETALHIAAYSPYTTPEVAKSIVEYTIRSHDWESLNSKDEAGNNALHVAAKYAKADVLWEFRSLRFKDVATDGNTPIHNAVRQCDPEVLETMLDIYESMQRDGNIDQPNCDRKTVLHLAAECGFSDVIARLLYLNAKLDAQDKNGNTILHNLIHSVVNDTKNISKYMEVFQTIVNECHRWANKSSHFMQHNDSGGKGRWANKSSHFMQHNDSGGEGVTKNLKRQALVWLTQEVRNNENLSVIALACKLGAYEILAAYFQLEDVSLFREDDFVWFDITGFTPLTSGSRTKIFFSRRTSTSIAPDVSGLDLLISSKDKSGATLILNLPPFREIENMYNMINLLVYTLITLLHIAYMGIFTFVGISISKSFGEGQSILSGSDGTFIASYTVLPMEPLIILILAIMNVYSAIKRRDFSLHVKKVIRYLFYFLYSAVILTWLILISTRDRNQDYVLASCLCLGWLFTLTFTQGFRPLHYFWRMLLNMVARDTSRFMVVYLFVLLAFAFSLHSLFQISKDISDTYSSPFDTLFLIFNVMVGMGEVFDDKFEQGMSTVGRSSTFMKVVYIVYVVLATIILLNMLIAMMNDSYAAILKMQTITWRLDSINRGIQIERLLPWSKILIRSIVNRRIPGEDSSFGVTKNFLKIPKEKYLKYQEEFLRTEVKSLHTEAFHGRLGELEKRLQSSEEQIADAKIKLEIIISLLPRLRIASKTGSANIGT